ncbi:hypothetical protein GUITHDRAFT_131458 [Guillardia theta CCMP2712]|uniref:Uncharacterized protein n=1 Tax=Guillardia theta (strain CCMP2712) TaxID=905079 RepID=L1K3P8_GUITC|nr:hypothetical protein GUITHDRAFT_131458 [Guillardia theta CCMP2712]EKX55202.1 hypothetical protein GUITHDRAFT_131458 [Guillardia theta CCMP2712]|eukprot:XP_005842182.1 hypothetical protein GUITHDRAFT_131458 [Guillardia theta CCMP2712]
MRRPITVTIILTIIIPYASQEHPSSTSCKLRTRCGSSRLKVKSMDVSRLSLRGGSSDLDDEIESIIDNNAMIERETEQGSAEDAGKEKRKTPARKKRHPLPNTAELFREISGNIILFSDFPGKHATKDTQYGWKSDRYLMASDPNVTLFNEDRMVPFDDEPFNWMQTFDERYNETWNVSEWSRDIEVDEDGDMITDHVVLSVLHGVQINDKAIYINMSNSHWKPPKGWKRMSPDQSDYQDPPPIYYEPVDYAYITWSQPKQQGTSRWIIHIDCSNGPLFLGVMKKPATAPKVHPEELKTRAWGISEGGFLQITVNSQAPFAFFGVDRDVVPFYCTKTPGDSIRLLNVTQGLLQIPMSLRNDVIARWSIKRCVVQEKGSNESKSYEFWPGGRIKMDVEEEEAELEKIFEDMADDKVLEDFENAFAEYNKEIKIPVP